MLRHDVPSLFRLRYHGGGQGRGVVAKDGDREVNRDEERTQDTCDIDAHLSTLVQCVILRGVRRQACSLDRLRVAVGVALVDVADAAHRGRRISSVDVVTTEVGINEYENTKPSIEILGAHVQHVLVLAPDEVTECKYDGRVVRFSRVRHKLRKYASHVLAVDVHHLSIVPKESSVAPVLLCATRICLLPRQLRGFKSILHPMPYNQSTDIARTDLSSWGSTWLVVRTNFPKANSPRTS